MATDAQMAWAAGLFEGEGCISLVNGRASSSNRTQPWVKLAIQMTDRDVLERFYQVVGTGGVSFHHRPSRKAHKDSWSWQAGARKEVERVLTEFLPWLGERRSAKALEALQLIQTLRTERPCDLCGAMFEPYRAEQRFCCREHQERAWHEANKTSGRRSNYAREHYLKNRDAYLERARRQRELTKRST